MSSTHTRKDYRFVACAFFKSNLNYSNGLSLMVNGRDVLSTTVFHVNSGASAVGLSGSLYASGDSWRATRTIGAPASDLPVCIKPGVVSISPCHVSACMVVSDSWLAWVGELLPSLQAVHLQWSLPWLSNAATGSGQLHHLRPVSQSMFQAISQSGPL